MVFVVDRPTQAQRRERTRAALIAAARELIAERGFADAGRDEIARRAGVTSGALYHHFESKAAVALAVVEAVDAELQERVKAAAARTSGEPLEQVRAACVAYLGVAAEPAFARILVEAPTIVGPAAVDAISESSRRLLESVLRSDSLDVPGDPGVLAHLLLGMLDEAARVVATDPRARRKVRATVDAMVVKLLGA